MVYPLLALLITYVAITVYRYFTEERQRKAIKSTFSRYASRRVIEQMLDNPDQLKLGGEIRHITVLFCDLAGFTSYSEIYTPHAMIDILGEYFNEMTEKVFAYEGLLKEYVGDELMAIFGAPLTQDDHAQKACLTALAMRDKLQIFEASLGRVGTTPVDGKNRRQFGTYAGGQHRFQVPVFLWRPR